MGPVRQHDVRQESGQRGTYTLCWWWQRTRRQWRPQPPAKRRRCRWRRRTWGLSARSSRGPAGTWCEWWGSRVPAPLRDTESRRWLSDRHWRYRRYTLFTTNSLLLEKIWKLCFLFLFRKQKLVMHFSRTEMYFISASEDWMTQQIDSCWVADRDSFFLCCLKKPTKTGFLPHDKTWYSISTNTWEVS